LFLEFRDKGSISAFEELLDRHKKQMVNFFYHLLGNDADANDFAQEVFIRLAQSAKGYQQTGFKFTCLLYRIANNLWIDHLRTRSPRKVSLESQVDDDGDTFLKNIIGGKGKVPLDEIIAEDEIRTLKALLIRLKEEQRIVVEMSVFRHLSYSEIADALGIPLGTVKTRMKTAVTYLKDVLSKMQNR